MENKGKLVEVQLEASEFQWEIAPEKVVDAWGFNKQLPGPVLKANQGDTLVVKLKIILKNQLLFTGMVFVFLLQWTVLMPYKNL